CWKRPPFVACPLHLPTPAAPPPAIDCEVHSPALLLLAVTCEQNLKALQPADSLPYRTVPYWTVPDREPEPASTTTTTTTSTLFPHTCTRPPNSNPLHTQPARLARHSRTPHHKERNRQQAEDKEKIEQGLTRSGNITHDAEEETDETRTHSRTRTQNRATTTTQSQKRKQRRTHAQTAWGKSSRSKKLGQRR
ncbi:hypothetical protein CCMA1212_008713, partial [Trichoderma ghanense]